MSTFQSKYDTWLIVLMAAAVALEARALVAIWNGSASWMVGAITSLPLAISTLFILWTLLGTRYVVTADRLRIVCGPMRWTIPLASIQAVQPSRSVIAGPAWSLDRLRIEARDQELLISPKDQAGFLAALHQSDPNLQQQGDRLERRAP